MTALPFFDNGLARLARIAAPGMLCAFDFDGTLAPIVRQPEQAAVPSAVLRRLERLCACTTVAIITGRSIADLRRRLPFEPHFVVGNHGLEGLPGLESQGEQWRRQCADWAESLSSALTRRRSEFAGAVLEDKGCSLALHYRLAVDRDAVHEALLSLCHELAPNAHVVGGKCVINLLPAAGYDKGYALERLIAASGATGALYVGDDLNDEDAFKLRRPDVLGVRIERDPASAAEFYLPHRLDMVRLLDQLLAHLQRPA